MTHTIRQFSETSWPERRIVSTSEPFADDSLLSVTVTTVRFGDRRENRTRPHGTGSVPHGQETAEREEGTWSLLDTLAIGLAGDEP